MTINIPLKDNHFLKSDGDQFLLVKMCVKERGDRKGETFYKNIGHYQSFYACLKSVPDRVLMDSDIACIKDFCDKWFDIFDTLKDELTKPKDEGL